jgi:DNA methylase
LGLAHAASVPFVYRPIQTSVILDPFCGCGTAIAVAQRLNRRWIGIDITHLAISLMKNRLLDSFGAAMDGAYRVIGEPVTLSEAEALAAEDKYQFQVVGARVSRCAARGTEEGRRQGH